MSKVSLILGIGGQDGSYLADLLLERGHEVHGLYRRSSWDNLWRISHCKEKLTLHRGDLLDSGSINQVLQTVQPHEIYNEADQDSVGWSQVCPSYQMEVTAASVGKLLEAVRYICPEARVFQPCSAMMYGDPASLSGTYVQNERTPFNPMSPYGVAKVAAYYLCKFYRERYGLFVSTGILFNHDSPRRSDHYLLHKICKGAVALSRGKIQELPLGNLDAVVDIGYAKEYMEAARLSLAADAPRDYVIGTGLPYTIRVLVEYAFDRVGKATLSQVTRDSEFWFPNVNGTLVANPRLIKRELGWEATTNGLRLIDILLEHELAKP